MALDEMKEDYPDRKLLCVDTLAASAGLGLLVKLACDKKKAGATIEETAAYIESIRDNLCHWFTVDDLVYLKRGGRISPTVAFVGNLLGIKPILHVDDEGHLINITKVRGRRTSVMALAQKYGELLQNAENNVAFISHGDCLEDAELLKTTLESKYGAKVELITPVGTVIGAHSGPGTLALFFIGNNR
jgi:DegV family protein with EDD domain